MQQTREVEFGLTKTSHCPIRLVLNTKLVGKLSRVMGSPSCLINKDYTPSSGGALFFDPGLGYGVEFDSYPYNLNDPQGYHIALVKNTTTNHLVYSYENKVTDNAWHNVSIEVSNTEVKITLDANQILKWNGIIDTSYGSIGFSAATGSCSNLQLIDDFEIKSNIDTISPTIIVNLENGTTIQKNSIFDLNVTATDNGNGIESLKTFLDGKLISNNQRLISQDLAVGKHVLEITCTDRSGNTARRTINFYVGTETIGSLEELLDDAYANNSINNKGVYNSLKVKLEKGNLIPFIRELYAQRGKHVKASSAQQLIESAWQEIKGNFQRKITKKEIEKPHIDKKDLKQFKGKKIKNKKHK